MSVAGRPPAGALGLGKTRTCPHCKATVLESANVCPGCRHHLRFDPGATLRDESSFTAWKVDGVIGPRGSAEACEYSVVIALRNEEGRELARHVVAVGALQPSERRSFTLSVDVIPPRPTAAPAPPRVDAPAPVRGTASPPNRPPQPPPQPASRPSAPPPARAPLASQPHRIPPMGSIRAGTQGATRLPVAGPPAIPPKPPRDPSGGA
jgi:hypothetical protein